jgi:phage terminase small subunit
MVQPSLLTQWGLFVCTPRLFPYAWGYTPTMTHKQKLFADGILSGKTGSDAYRHAYPDSKAHSGVIAVKAHQLSNHPEIKALIAKERAAMRKKDILSREESLGILAKIARKPDKQTTAIAAIERAAKMQGFDVPQAIEMKIEGSLLDRIRRKRQ